MEIELPDRGQVGTGTLIIFIAMLLVASIAASVLINTSGLLQSTATDTSKDSQEQVSQRIVITQAIGVVNHSGDKPVISEMRFTIRKAPGSGPVDLSELYIEYLSDEEFKSITNATIVGNETTLKNERRYLKLNFDNQSVEAGSEMTFRFNTKTGGTTLYTTNVPNDLHGEDLVQI